MPGGKKNKKENIEVGLNCVEGWRNFTEALSEIEGARAEASARGERISFTDSILIARADFEVNQEIEKKMARSAGTPVVCYEESDQSPLSGESRMLLRAKWATGMDYAPYHIEFGKFLSTAWAKALFSGDYEGVLEIIQGKTEIQIKQLLGMRESLMNYCAVFHVVQGARGLHSTTQWKDIQICHRNLNVKNEHVKILLKLLSLGVDVNVRDVAGFTPLHHCCQLFGNDVTLQMAEILIKAGAEVDAKNRFGETPLWESTINNKLDFISLLLKYGANHSVKDNDGCSPQDKAYGNPQIMRIFGEAEKIQAKKERKAEKDNSGARLSACSVCQTGRDTKKCTGCFSVWFCGRECQLSAWPDHKKKCKETRAQYSMCHLRPTFSVGQSMITGQFYETNNSGPSKQHFVVKIQLSLDSRRKPVRGEQMVIYDKDRSFTFILLKEFNEAVHPRLEKIIIEKGVDGLKGFFHAIKVSLATEKKGKSKRLAKMEINIENILMREAW